MMSDRDHVGVPFWPVLNNKKNFFVFFRSSPWQQCGRNPVLYIGQKGNVPPTSISSHVMLSQVKDIPTKPFDGQKPSPYGLIKRLAHEPEFDRNVSDCKA